MSIIEFLKKHSSLISNIMVVLLVLGAVYVKLQEQGTDSLFRFEDIYILVGAMLGLVVLRFLSKRKESQPDRKKKQ